MTDDVLAAAKSKMAKSLEVLERELMGLRTGRASPGLVEHVRVEYFGTPTPMGQLATISAPEAHLLVIQPWDKTALAAIEKAILKSDLGLNPANDGNIIRLVIPQLTEERRREFVKVLRKRIEQGRIAIRNVRREAVEKLRDMKRDKVISEDEEKRALSQIQVLTDGFIENVDRMGNDKEVELLEG